MKKYITKNNMIQLLLLLQFILLQVPNFIKLDSEILTAISFCGLIVGYVINTTKKG